MKKLLPAIIYGLLALFAISCGKETHIAVTSITLNKTAASIAVGETVQLSAVVSPSEATDKSLTWASSNSVIATVSGNGLVTAIAEGTTLITASAGGKTVSCNITVTPNVIPVISISLEPTEITMVEGQSSTLIATVKPDDATDKSISWSSSESSVASVDQNGKVTALSKGSSVITAQAKEFKATCNVSVVSASLSVLYKTTTGNLASLNVTEGVKENRASSEKGWNELVLEPDVTSLKEWFRENKDVTEIIIPEGVDSISNHAFYSCSNLVSINLPESLLDIGARAFNGCSGLSQLTLPTMLKSIGYHAFNSCRSLISIDIPDSVETVGEGFLSVCNSLKSINGERYYIRDGVLLAFAPFGITSAVLPESIVRIGENVFGACDELVEIILPSGLTSIGSNAFWYSGIKSITIPNTVIELGEMAFYYCEYLENVTLSDNLTSIELGTFQFCKRLKSITVPDSVLSVGNSAFSSCDNLYTVTMGSGVKTLKNYIVSNSPNILYINFRSTVPPQLDEFSFTDDDTSAFFFVPSSSVETYRKNEDWGRYELIIYSAPEEGNIVFENDVVKNDCVRVLDSNGDGEVSYWEAASASRDDVFSLQRGEYTSFNEFRFFRTTRTIPRSFFWNCARLKNISLPETIKSVEPMAFAYCTSLQSIVIPEGTIEIGYSAFQNCTSLSTISIPETVVEVGTGLLMDCTNLESINGEREYVRDNVIYAFAPKGVATYAIHSGVSGIAMYAFKGCINLKSVTIPGSVTSIGPWAFDGCDNFESVTVNATRVPEGGSYMFPSPNNNNYPIYVPAGTVSAYRAAQYWSEYAERIQAIPE